MQTINTLEYVDIIKPAYLSKEFLAKYASKKAPFPTVFGLVVFLRTYSRFIPQLKRREYWWETVARVVDYSMSLYKGPASYESLKQEAEELYDGVYSLKVFPAGRSLWVGGTNVVEKNGTANFNCSFRVKDNIEAFSEIFYLLLVGAGTGFSVENKYVKQLPKLNSKVEILHQNYNPLPKAVREEFTQVSLKAEGYQKTFNLREDYIVDSTNTILESAILDKPNTLATIEFGDSKFGWVGGLKAYLHLLTSPNVKAITFVYDSVRPAGERLLTMGGRASGPEPLRKMFEKIDWTIKHYKGILNSVATMDICNFIAEGVVVGGVRRSSQIALGDWDDKDFVDAKFNLWTGGILDKGVLTDNFNLGNETKTLINLLSQINLNVNLETLEEKWSKKKNSEPWLSGVPLDLVLEQFGGDHKFLWSNLPEYKQIESFIDNLDPKFRYRASRVMSNNSIHLYFNPGLEALKEIFSRIESNGEPGIYIAENATKRRPNYKGTNPCSEILLDNQGVCNLTEVNVHAFVRGINDFDYEGFYKAVKLATRAGSRITNVDMWHPEWDKVQKRDRLLGASLTGQVEAWDALGWGYTIDEKGNYKYINDTRIDTVLEKAKLVERQEADSYHEEMSIPKALLISTGKPSGTIAQLPSVSSGCHRPYAPYYLRRIRISKFDPVAKSLRKLGVPVVPENKQGTDLDAEQCNTWVFTFPMKTSAPIRAIDESAIDQLKRYQTLMQKYIEHNQSITITVAGAKYDENYNEIAPSEWIIVAEWVANPDNWKDIVGVSFLPKWDPTEGGESIYPNLPYQPSYKEEFNQYSSLTSLSEENLVTLISEYERDEYLETELDKDCTTGCPIR